MPSVPRPQGQIVEFASFPSRFEADVIIAMLATNGIRPIADDGDSDGWAPHLALHQGARVLVLDDDLDRARGPLASASPFEEPTNH